MTKEKYILIHDNDSYEVVEINPDHWLDEVRKAIGCDWIEHIPGIQESHSIHAIGDEIALLYDPPKKYNRMANAILLRSDIHGDVVLCGEGLRNGEPDFVPLPEREFDEVLKVLAEMKFFHELFIK